MIVGCYSVDLYCENLETDSCLSGWRREPPQYTGETEAECLRQARQDGWLFTRDRPRQAFCPKCAKKRRGKK